MNPSLYRILRLAKGTEVGPFTVLNTEGHSDAEVKKVSALLLRAAQILRSKGLAKLCYGDVDIVSKFSQATALASYLPWKDQIEIKANFPPNKEPLRLLLHEFGHRMEKMFLQGKVAEIKKVYNKLKRTKVDLPIPKLGDSVAFRGTTFYALQIKKDPKEAGGYKIWVGDLGASTAKAILPLAAFNHLAEGKDENEHYSSGSAFITHYARKDPSENFAEMFSFYCIDELPQDQVKLIESILG